MARNSVNKTVELIRTTLLKNGLNVSDWARGHAFEPKDTIKYINRYAVYPGTPNSPKVYRILAQLHEDTGINLMRRAV